MAKGKPVGSATLNEAVMDQIVKFAFGPQKLSLKQTAEKTGVSEDSVRRVLKAYTLVGNGEEDEIIDRVASRDMSMNHVTWAYNYYGYSLPEGIEARVTAKLRGESFTQETEEKPKTTEGENLLVLCERINAIGRALSDCLTESTAAKLTDKITVALKEGQASANANADMILAEMKKQTELLQRIEMNTKKLRRDIQA